MRKTAALFLALTLVLCGAGAYAAKQLDEPKDKPEYTLTDRYGDRSFAEGLAFRHKLEYTGHMFWDTALEVKDGELKTDTDFSFSNEYVHSDYNEHDCYGMHFYMDLSAYFPYDGIPSGGIADAWKEMIEETPAGSSREKTVDLKDYETYYPFILSLELEDLYFGYYPGIAENDLPYEEYKTIMYLKNYFRIPVREGSCYILQLEKNADGNDSFGYGGLTPEDSDFYEPAVFNAVGDNAVYFCFSSKTAKGNTVDTSLIPGGYGIYVLPFSEKTETDENAPFAETNIRTEIHTEDLKCLYPVDPSADILYMSRSQEHDQLLLCTEKDGNCRCAVISSATGEETAGFDLGPFDKSMEFSIYDGFAYGDDFFVVRTNGILHVLYMTDSGTWEKAFSYTPQRFEQDTNIMGYNFGNPGTMAFDGTRLAFTGRSTKDWEQQGEYYRTENCAVSLAVYTKDGLQYYGTADCSLGLTNYHITNDDSSVYYREIGVCRYSPDGCRWN